MADNHGHQRLLVQLLNGQVGAASPGPERHLHAFTQQRSPCRGNGAGGRLPPIALTLGGGLPQRRAPVGEPAPAIPVAPAKLSNPHRSPRRPHDEVPDLTYSDETGFAEQQDLMIKALGPSPRRWSPEAAGSSRPRLVGHSDGHSVPMTPQLPRRSPMDRS